MDKQGVGYLRVSGKGQLAGGGLDRQKDVIARYAKSAGIVVQEWYREAHTGTKADRPEFSRMLEDLLSNGCRRVIVESLDRLARDLGVQMRLLALLVAKGVTLINASTGQDVTRQMQDDPMLKAMVQVQGTFAELDKSLTVRKLRRARERVRASEGRCEGRKAFGYHDNEKPVARRMRALYRKPRGGERRSWAEIARILNAEGHATRTGVPWSGMTVRQILAR